MKNQKPSRTMFFFGGAAILLSLGACATSSEASKSETDSATVACDGEGQHLVEGDCYQTFEAACEALSCSPPLECVSLESMPPQATCREMEAKEVECAGEEEHLANGECFPSLEAACEALGCSESQECVSLESMPLQAACRDVPNR